MREIKFRAWDKEAKAMFYFDLYCVILRKSSVEQIMQYTGLKDKNGVEIYEGDIVDLDTWKGTQQISFIEGAFCLANADGTFAGDIHYCQHADRKQAEVIGNIYENKEL